MAKDEKKRKVIQSTAMLTEHERNFVSFYLYDKKCRHNLTEAYIKAYDWQGKRRSAAVLAVNLFNKKRVNKEVNKQYIKINAQIGKDWFRKKLQTIEEDAKHPRDKVKTLELLAKIERIIGNDDRQPDGITFNIGVPRPARPGAPDPAPVVEVDGEKFD